MTQLWDIYNTGYVLQSTSGFQFEALPGHPDGAGLIINFEFRYSVATLQATGKAITELDITTRILNDFGPVGNTGYRQGAIVTWNIFGNNLRSKLT